MRILSRGHIADRRLAALAETDVTGQTPSGRESSHLRSCNQCRLRQEAFGELDRAMSGSWRLRRVDAQPRLRTSMSMRPGFALISAAIVVGVAIAGRYVIVQNPNVNPSSTTVGSTTARSSVTSSLPPSASPKAVTAIAFANLHWSPDSSDLLASTGDNRILIIGADGSDLAEFAGTTAGWLSSGSIAIWTSTPGYPEQGTIRLVTVSSGQSASVAGEFGPPVYAPGSSMFAAPLVTATGEKAEFRVWSGGALSPPRQGIPLAWSSGGNMLAVLMPNDKLQSSGPGQPGSIVVEAIDGSTIRSYPSVITDSSAEGPFSADGAYLEICSSSTPGTACAPTVLEIASGQAWVISGSASVVTWLPDDVLLTSGPDGTALEWRDGTESGAAIPAEAYAAASTKGDLAFVWGDARTTAMLRVGGRDRELTLPGAPTAYIPVWSPDGVRVAYVVATESSTGGQEIVILSASE